MTSSNQSSLERVPTYDDDLLDYDQALAKYGLIKFDEMHHFNYIAFYDLNTNKINRYYVQFRDKGFGPLIDDIIYCRYDDYWWKYSKQREERCDPEIVYETVIDGMYHIIKVIYPHMNEAYFNRFNTINEFKDQILFELLMKSKNCTYRDMINVLLGDRPKNARKA